MLANTEGAGPVLFSDHLSFNRRSVLTVAKRSDLRSFLKSNGQKGKKKDRKS